MPPNHEPAITLLGIRIHTLPVEALIERIVCTAQNRQRTVVAYVNAHGLNLAHDAPALRNFFNAQAAWVFCDGFGVKWGARLAGQPSPPRYTPPDWIDRLCDECATHGLSIYLLGDAPATVEKAAQTLQARHAGLKIAGWQHGFFDKTAGSAETPPRWQPSTMPTPTCCWLAWACRRRSCGWHAIGTRWKPAWR